VHTVHMRIRLVSSHERALNRRTASVGVIRTVAGEIAVWTGCVGSVWLDYKQARLIYIRILLKS
jgi:hypothetical protein